MSASQSKVKKQLKAIISNEPGSIRAAVATEALLYERIDTFFNDFVTARLPERDDIIINLRNNIGAAPKIE